MSMTRLVVALLGAAALSFMIVSMLMIVSDSSVESRNLLDSHSGGQDHDGGDHHSGDHGRDDDDDDVDPPGDTLHTGDFSAIDVTSSSVDDDDDARIETDCGFLKSHWVLRKALAKVVCGRHDRPDCGTKGFPGASQNNGGFGLNMWASIVNRAGRVCAVAYSGEDFDNQWLGSRVISVQKAYAANAFFLGRLRDLHCELVRTNSKRQAFGRFGRREPGGSARSVPGIHWRLGTVMHGRRRRRRI